MPIIASNAKRAKTNKVSEAANKTEKSRLKTTLREFKRAVEAEDKEKATALSIQANKLLDKSITSGIHHKNYVSRKKSDIATQLNTLK